MKIVFEWSQVAPPAVLSIKRSLSNVLLAEVIEEKIQTFFLIYFSIFNVGESICIHPNVLVFKFEAQMHNLLLIYCN